MWNAFENRIYVNDQSEQIKYLESKKVDIVDKSLERYLVCGQHFGEVRREYQGPKNH